MDIQAAAQTIIARADKMKPRAAATFLAENVRFHQDKCRRIVEARVKPKGWTFGLHEELIHLLINAELEARSRRATA